MASQEDGFATATLELTSGYPGYFYSPGDGDYIFAMHTKYGLPIRLAGDNGPDFQWIRGFNQAVVAHVEQHGLPWNSRLSSLDILSDLPDYLHRKAPPMTWLRLQGEALSPNGFGFKLSLEHGSMGVSVKLESESLFQDPKIVPGAMMAYRTGPPPAAPPAVPRPPALQPGTKSVWLRFFDDAEGVECVPAPLGSHLVVFRFSRFDPNSWRKRVAPEALVAFDTQLADWIPGQLCQLRLT